MRCLRDHCMDCIIRSKELEYTRGHQGQSLDKISPACLGCGKTSIWKGIEYKKKFLDLPLDVRNGPIDSLAGDFQYLTDHVEALKKWKLYRQRQDTSQKVNR